MIRPREALADATPAQGDAPTVLEGPAVAAADASDDTAVADGAPTDEAGPRLPPQIGRYTLLRELGQGGMGLVYVAYDEALNRRVALKILRARILDSEVLQARMQREAQALAKISHPNVVQIYDVGRHGDRVFVAMELIDGATLRQWLKDAPRPWREVLGVLRQAGEGLSAAHQAGLIHRDIKPENILVGADGRVRVADFGLARAEHLPIDASGRDEPAADDADDGAPIDLRLSSSSSPLHSPLTVAGTLLGTPAYMAPEQHLRQPADSRADIYSFCVVAHEALLGERPFAAADRAALVQAIFTGEIRPPPRESKVPARLLRVIRRGLSATPEERPPTMAALLADLRRDPERSRRRALQGVALAAAFVGAGALGARLRDPPPPTCSAVHHDVLELWGDGRRSAVRAAMATVGGELGPTTWERLHGHLDAYVGRLHGAHAEACEERRDGRISDRLHDLKIECLERRRAQVDALTELLAAADQAITERAIEAVRRLPDVDACADVSSLLARAAPPDDPAIAAAVRELRGRLDRARSLRRVGSFAAAAEVVEGALATAETLGYPPVVGEALIEAGLVAVELADHRRAADELFPEGLRLAEQSGDDELRLEALSGLVAAHAASGAPAAMLDFLAPQALALIERLGVRGGATHGRLLVGLGETYLARDRVEQAIAPLEEAETIFTALGDDARADLAAVLNDLAMIHSTQGRTREAHALYQRSRAALIAALGPHHPFLGHLHNNEGRVFEKEGDRATARANFESALTIWESVYGEDHRNIAMVTLQLARVAFDLGDLEAAEAHARRSVAIRERRAERSLHTDAPLLIAARCAEARGDLVEAARLGERSLRAAEQRFGATSTQLLDPLRLLAALALRTGDLAAASAAAERGLGLEIDETAAAELRFLDARARWLGGAAAEAREQARAARASAAPELAAEIDAWLAEHLAAPGPRR